MKNKKGFTLVELLAVIAILAILVIMALPAVLRMYRQSRINNFQNETRSVYRTAQSKFLSDSMLLESGQKILYTNGCTTSSDADIVKTLEMTGNSNFKYYVLIDVDGKVLDVKTSNGTYSYLKHGTDLKVEELNVEDGNGVDLDSDISATICTANGSSGGSGGTSNSVVTYTNRQVANTITQGDVVTVNNDQFYVVDTNPTNTTLIAKNGVVKYTKDGSNYILETAMTNEMPKYKVTKLNELDNYEIKKMYYDEYYSTPEEPEEPEYYFFQSSNNNVYEWSTEEIDNVLAEYKNYLVSMGLPDTITVSLPDVDQVINRNAGYEDGGSYVRGEYSEGVYFVTYYEYNGTKQYGYVDTISTNDVTNPFESYPISTNIRPIVVIPTSLLK